MTTIVRPLYVDAIGEAPIRFYERGALFPECPWVATLDVFRALAYPEVRDEAVITSMARDYLGGVYALGTEHGAVVLIAQPLVCELLKAAGAIGKQFDATAWAAMFNTAARGAMSKILARLPPDGQDLFAEVALRNTWSGWS